MRKFIAFPNQLKFHFHPLYYCSNSNQPKPIKESSQKLKKTTREQYQDFLRFAIVEAQKNQQKKPQGKEEYRAAILFEDILKKEKNIVLYDTRGIVYNCLALWYLASCILAFLAMKTVIDQPQWYRNNLNHIKMGIATTFVLTRLFLYRRLYHYQVEKIIYDTLTKDLTITKRSFIGFRKEHQLRIDKLLYTQDKLLNAKRINYINIENLECYSIGYTFAWKNKELFSHLIQQNVKDIKSGGK